MSNIKNMSNSEIAQYLRNERDCALILWQKGDITSHAKERDDINLTDEQAAKVIETLNRRRDCDYGITWHHVNEAIFDVVNPE